jgi:hypothetical protein
MVPITTQLQWLQVIDGKIGKSLSKAWNRYGLVRVKLGDYYLIFTAFT